jgi:hypothetical protein
MTHAFPDVLAHRETQDLVQVFAEGPARVRSAVDGLEESDLRARPRGPGTWSILEIVLHLADAEIMGAARIRQGLAEPGAAFGVYDQDRWATQLRYGTAGLDDLAAGLALFGNLREATVGVFRRMRYAEWENTGVHPEWGVLTVRQLLELYADHGERHIRQILAIRARLGRPLDLPVRLERPLY